MKYFFFFFFFSSLNLYAKNDTDFKNFIATKFDDRVELYWLYWAGSPDWKGAGLTVENNKLCVEGSFTIENNIFDITREIKTCAVY